MVCLLDTFTDQKGKKRLENNEEFSKDYKSISKEEIDTKKAIIPQINKIIQKDRFNHYRPLSIKK